MSQCAKKIELPVPFWKGVSEKLLKKDRPRLKFILAVLYQFDMIMFVAIMDVYM
jgi:hypothetical protein